MFETLDYIQADTIDYTLHRKKKVAERFPFGIKETFLILQGN